MAEEDARDVKRGIHFPHRVSAAVFVRMGLEVEDHQCVTKKKTCLATNEDTDGD